MNNNNNNADGGSNILHADKTALNSQQGDQPGPSSGANDGTNDCASANAACTNTSLVIRNVTVDGRRTSLRLEPEMWCAFQDISKRERASIHDLCTMISLCKSGPGSLTAAVRVFIMGYFRCAATDEGHNRVGHGSGSVLQPLYDKMPATSKFRRGYIR